ncbi:MAG: hypothetical protein ACLTMP_13035 [Eggerthella lenta]
MATGSFAGSTAMIGWMNAECANLPPGSNPGATGDGLVMAKELGAYTIMSGHAADELLAGLESGSIVNINYGMRLLGSGSMPKASASSTNRPLRKPQRAPRHRAKQNEQGSPVIALLGTTPSWTPCRLRTR